jgi:hypothetical protein
MDINKMASIRRVSTKSSNTFLHMSTISNFDKVLLSRREVDASLSPIEPSFSSCI